MLIKERLDDDRFAESGGFIADFLACVGETQTQISQNLSSARQTHFSVDVKMADSEL